MKAPFRFKSKKSAGVAAVAVAGVATAAVVAAALMSGEPEEQASSSPSTPRRTHLVTTVNDVYVYGSNHETLGALPKDSCVTANLPFPDQKFVPVHIWTPQNDSINGFVSGRFLTEKTMGATPCRATIRPLYADPARPDTGNLPLAETYRVAVGRADLYFGADQPASGLSVSRDSCVAVITSGQHTADMINVIVTDRDRIGEAFIRKADVTPVGPYNSAAGCRATITGTAENRRPASSNQPAEKRSVQPIATTETAPQSLQIQNGELYIVTADQLTLRSGPDTGYAPLNALFRDSCVQALGTRRNENGFVQVLTSYDQRSYQKGFVAQEYLKPAPEGLGKMQCFLK